MSEASLTVEAVSAELREAARSTVGEPGGVQEPENSIDGQLSDSKSNPGGGTDQLQSPLGQHLRTMASPEAMADFKTLREIINADTPKVNVQDSITKVAPLHIAAKRGLVSAIGVLLNAGARLAVQDREGATPFFTATEAEQADAMEELLKHRSGDDDVKSPLEIRDNAGRTPLLLASINGFLKGVKLLIDAGANRNAQTFESKSTPLIAASSWGYQDVVEALLDHDSTNPSRRADLNLQNADGATALHVAIIEGRHTIAELLLNVGVDVTIKDNNGQSTLHLASRQGHQSVVNGLLGMKANVDDYDGGGRTPLHIAIDSLQKVQSKLSLGLFRWAGLKEENLSEARPQTAQYIAIIQLLLAHGARPVARTAENETALHLAIACGELSILNGIIGEMKPDDFFIRNRKGQTALSSLFQLKGQKRAVAMETFAKLSPMKIAKFDTGDELDNALYWAANDSMSHDVVRLILTYKSTQHATLPAGYETWSAIGWAAHRQLPKLLSLLISSSSGTEQIEHALRSILASPLELVKRLQSREASDQPPLVILWQLITALKRTTEIEEVLKKASEKIDRQTLAQESRKAAYFSEVTSGARGNEHHGTGLIGSNTLMSADEYIKKPVSNQETFKSKHLKMLKDILRDPPLARGHKQLLDYNIPQPKIEVSLKGVLGDYEAHIVQFNEVKGIPRTLQAKRPISEVIYEVGPAEIMQTGITMRKAMQTAVANLNGDPVEIEPACDFTWVHLPTTNMDWMNDLLTRILKDEECCPRQYYEAKSFFQDSWVEVPDGKSESKIMRPRTVFRQSTKQVDCRRQDPGEGSKNPGVNLTELDRRKACRHLEDIEIEDRQGWKPKELGVESKENGRGTSNPDFDISSAIYMPYLCFSVNLDKGQKKFQNLLAAYPKSIVHRSPTLDEWYYHFAGDQASVKDRDKRNESQVITRYSKGGKSSGQNKKNEEYSEGSSQSSEIELIRVNQIWMWTIGNKWLITANSCLFGESDGALVQDVLDQLNKQAEYGGRKSQPGSAVEMSRLIVEHCIGSYDRRPKLEGQPADNKTSFINTVPSVNQKEPLAVKDVSIGQIYSNHMNKVGRDEIALFEAFQNWKQNGWSNSHRHARSKTGSKSSQSSSFCKDSSKALTGLLVYDDIETTIHKAYTLSNDIKDVRDELNILKSVAQYQEIVQTGLADNSVKDGELSAAYVVKNIKELDIVADRIQSAINMTLSLQQSEIANRNAVLSIQHGKVLMIFTFATLLFLPLSFLSSLFALDVSSFLQTPNWAFLVLFLVSIAISIAVGFVAFYAEDIRRNAIGVWRELMVKLTTRSKDRRHAFSSV